MDNRNIRQRDVVPPDKLARYRVTVVGVGAIGRQVAIQLSVMGVPALQLIDPDTVEEVNLGCQAFLEEDLGRRKVEATAAICHSLNRQVDIETVPRRFGRFMETGEILFCCVDSIETRRFIWQSVRDRVAFFCDGRMSAEVLRVLVAADESSRDHYADTHFSNAAAYQGACTARSTIYCANVAAGLMVSQYAKFLRGLPIDADITLNLLAGEWAVF